MLSAERLFKELCYIHVSFSSKQAKAASLQHNPAEGQLRPTASLQTTASEILMSIYLANVSLSVRKQMTLGNCGQDKKPTSSSPGLKNDPTW